MHTSLSSIPADQPPAAPAPPTGWTNLLAALPAPTTPPPSYAASGEPEIPLDERLALAAEWLLPRLLAGESPTARDVLAGVEEFRGVYRTANAIGTILGLGVAGHGLKLHRRSGRVLARYENAHRLVEMLGTLAPDRLESAARRAGHSTPEALTAAVLTLKPL